LGKPRSEHSEAEALFSQIFSVFWRALGELSALSACAANPAKPKFSFLQYCVIIHDVFEPTEVFVLLDELSICRASPARLKLGFLQ
jgi:hypothetical protein